MEPLVDYVRSVIQGASPFTEDQIAELMRIIRERIDAAGAFHITKTCGLFCASEAHVQ